MPFNSLNIVRLAPALLIACTVAAAQDKVPDTTRAVPLGGVSVHAQVRDVPPVEGVTSFVDAQDLEQHNTVESADILNYLPNLTLRKRYIGDRNAILGGRSAGTLQSARSLVYADGLLLSDFLDSGWGNPPRWGMVAPQDIESIDVLYGPYSALYPGNAMGSTVIFHTRMPERFEASASVQGFSQSFKDGRGGDGDYRGHRESVALGNRAGPWQWRLSLERLDNRGQPMNYASARPGGDADHAIAVTGASPDRNPDGSTRLLTGPTGMDHTRQDQASLRLGLDLAADSHALFTFGYWRNRSDVHAESSLRDADGNRVHAGPVRVDKEVWTLSDSAFAPSATRENHRLLGLEFKGRLGDLWHWDATASDYAILTSDNARASQPAPLARAGGPGRVSDNGGSGWRTLDLRFNGPVGDTQTLWLGAHADRYTLASTSRSASDWRQGADGPRSAAFGGRTRTLALYAQDEWTVSDEWTASVGVRAESWRAFDGRRAGSGAWTDYPSRSRTALSPKAAVAWAFAEDWQLRLSTARAVRFPTVGELFQGTLDSEANIVNNDPDLKPEQSWASDLSLQHGLANGHWRVSLFQNTIRDSLYRQTDVTVTPMVTSIQNVDRMRLRGLEGAFSLRELLPGLDLSGSVAFNASRTLRDRRYPVAEGKEVPRIPRSRATFTADWRFSPGWNVSLAMRHSGRQFSSLDNSDHINTFGAVSNYTMADAQIGWQFARGWRASLGVDNLANRQAWVYHPWPGRTWFASVHWKSR